MDPTLRSALFAVLAFVLAGQVLSWLLRGRATKPSAGTPMDNYTKLATLLVRVFGIIMILYAVPMVLVGILWALAAGNWDNTFQSLALWLAYGAVGVLAYFGAVPIAHRAAYGLQETAAQAPPPNKR